MIRNKGSVALNVRFNYATARHYRLNPNTKMPSDPEGAYRGAPARVACGVPATGRANGRCYRNDGVSTPEPYSNGAKHSLESRNLGQSCPRSTTNEIRNTCSGVTLNVGARCGTSGQFTHYFLIPPGERIPGSPLNCSGSFAVCGAPGVPQTYNGTYRCYINTGITPVQHPGTRVTPRSAPPPTSLYGSIAVGRDSQGTRRSSINYGRTRSEARTNARSYACRGTVTVCKSIEFGRGQCAALAVGEGGGEAGAGFAVSNTRQAAQNSALEACRNTGATNCRIATDNDGEAFSSCLTSSSTQSSVREQSGVF